MHKRSLFLCLAASICLCAQPASAQRGGKRVRAFFGKQVQRAQLAWARHVVLPVTSSLLTRSVQTRAPDDPERVVIERNLTAVRTCMQPLAEIKVPRPLRWREARQGRSLLGAAKAMVTHKVTRDIAVTRKQGWRLHRQRLQQERDYTTNLLQSRGAGGIRHALVKKTNMGWRERQKKRVELFVLDQHIQAVNVLRQLDAIPPRP
jgi:hypothetical protein